MVTAFSQTLTLQIEHEEVFHTTLQFDDWTKRSQTPADEKAGLEQIFLTSDEHTQQYFDITRRSDGHLDSFKHDVALLKGRKQV